MDEHKSDKHGTRTRRSLGENQIVIKESNCTEKDREIIGKI